MNYRTNILLLGILLIGCTGAPAAPTATFTSTAAPSPTITLTPLPTSTPTPLPLPAGTKVIFDESGSREFAGTTYGQGETAILLANMSIGGETQWDPFVAAVDKQKFTTITFNYRNINEVDQDMELILSYLKEAGFERVICLGASLGTTACGSIARAPEIVGIVLIAGAVHHASVAETTYPKLFISGELDPRAFDIQTGYEKAAEPKTLKLFENSRSHGTDLFRSEDSDEFLTLLIDFVNSLAAP